MKNQSNYKIKLITDNFIKLYIFLLCIVNTLFSQEMSNRTTLKYLAYEANYSNRFHKDDSKKSFFIKYYQHHYFNTNLPNLENFNGLYFPKGNGFITSIYFKLNFRNFTFTFEPQTALRRIYSSNTPKKDGAFSVLNDTPLNYNESVNFKNFGLKLNYNNFIAGYGNWNQWWGPGVHNSLIMTNNSKGFYHTFIGTKNFIPISSQIRMKFKYMFSNPMINKYNENYYLSIWQSQLIYRDIEFGLSRHILSGGYDNIKWDILDAAKIPITNENIRYWDEIIDFYIKYNPKKSGLVVFLEIGSPNRGSNRKTNKFYNDNALASNLGFRKYGIFENENIMVGIEYTRLVQGIYYNLTPTPNWYDNIKYNYSSYLGRRWAAHSGADSDDFLLLLGYFNNNSNLIVGLNYERHGVNYHFPPEVKLEFRLSASYSVKKFLFNLNYESEYYEHYGFIDQADNIWQNTFEDGSLQRTKTLVFTIEKSINN